MPLDKKAVQIPVNIIVILIILIIILVVILIWHFGGFDKFKSLMKFYTYNMSKNISGERFYVE